MQELLERMEAERENLQQQVGELADNKVELEEKIIELEMNGKELEHKAALMEERECPECEGHKERIGELQLELQAMEA